MSEVRIFITSLIASIVIGLLIKKGIINIDFNLKTVVYMGLIAFGFMVLLLLAFKLLGKIK